MDRKEQEILERIRERAEEIQVPETLYPEEMKKRLRKETSSMQKSKYRKRLYAAGSVAAACVVFAAGLLIWGDRQEQGGNSQTEVSWLEDTLADVRMDEDGEMRIIGIEGTVSVRINLYEEEELNLLEDLYSLEQKVSYQTGEAVYEELLLQNQSKCKIVENLSLPELKDDVLQICHSSGSVQIEHVETRAEKQGGILIEGILHVSFLYLKADDALPFGNWQGMVPFSYLLECPDMPKDVRYQLSNRVEQISVTMTGRDSVEVKAVLDFDVFLRKEVPMQVITEVSLEETDREELAKKPGIVGYMVKSGDDLWTLAKQYMTTEESIRQINHLENGKIKPGDKLIICKEIGM